MSLRRIWGKRIQGKGLSLVGQAAADGVDIWKDDTDGYIHTEARVQPRFVEAPVEQALGLSTSKLLFGAIYKTEYRLMGGNYILYVPGDPAAPVVTPPTPGSSGRIRFVQDGSGSRTLSFGGTTHTWVFEGGTVPSLTTAPGATDILLWEVLTANAIWGILVKDVK